ncbi:MAG: ABC transporter substrate-binding protein [bacterium]
MRRILKSMVSLILVSIFLSICLINVVYGEQITLVYAHWFGNVDYAAQAKAAVEAYMKLNPNIKIEILHIPWAQYWVKIPAMCAAKEGPDVFNIDSATLRDFVDMGVLEEITPSLLKKLDIDLSTYHPFVWKEVKIYGKIWTIPYGISPSYLIYNKTMFEKAGINRPDVNWNWNDFLTAAKKLTEPASGATPGKFGTFTNQALANYWAQYIWQNGGEILNTQHTKCLLDQPKAVEAMQWIQDLIIKHKVAPLPDALQAMGGLPFMSGRIGMYTGWTGIGVLSYNQIKDFEWAATILPKHPTTGKRTPVARVGGEQIAIYKESKHKEEAIKFAKFLADYMGTGGIGFVPANTKLWEKYFINHPRTSKIAKASIEMFKYARPNPYTNKFNEWDTATQEEVVLMFSGEKTAEQAMKDATRRVDAILASIKKK